MDFPIMPQLKNKRKTFSILFHASGLRRVLDLSHIMRGFCFTTAPLADYLRNFAFKNK